MYVNFKLIFCLGQAVAIGGTGFASNAVVTYGPGPAANLYPAVSCLVSGTTSITCQTSPGVGKDLQWKVTVDVDSALSTQLSAYSRPNIDSFFPANTLRTQGSDLITIRGTNFVGTLVMCC